MRNLVKKSDVKSALASYHPILKWRLDTSTHDIRMQLLCKRNDRVSSQTSLSTQQLRWVLVGGN